VERASASNCSVPERDVWHVTEPFFHHLARPARDDADAVGLVARQRRQSLEQDRRRRDDLGVDGAMEPNKRAVVAKNQKAPVATRVVVQNVQQVGRRCECFAGSVDLVALCTLERCEERLRPVWTWWRTCREQAGCIISMCCFFSRTTHREWCRTTVAADVRQQVLSSALT